MSLKLYVLDSKEEWLANRDRIGGSDSAAIVGMSPYRTNLELWKIKTHQMGQSDISQLDCVKYGTEAEIHLRELFKLDFLQYQVMYEENNMWINDKFPFAHASLDGWLVDQSGRKGILEIKTTNIQQGAQREKWNKRIPDNYYIQLLHYLMVTEFDFAVLKAQLKYDYGGDVYLQTKHYQIERKDVEKDILFLETAEREFWRYVQRGIQPPLHLPEIN